MASPRLALLQALCAPAMAHHAEQVGACQGASRSLRHCSANSVAVRDRVQAWAAEAGSTLCLPCFGRVGGAAGLPEPPCEWQRRVTELRQHATAHASSPLKRPPMQNPVGKRLSHRETEEMREGRNPQGRTITLLQGHTSLLALLGVSHTSLGLATTLLDHHAEGQPSPQNP